MNHLFPYFAVNPIAEAYRSSDLFGKGIFLALFALSITTWVILLQKSLQNRRAEKGKESFCETIKQYREKFLSNGLMASPMVHPFYSITQTLHEKALPIVKERGFITPPDREMIEAYLHTTISNESKKLKESLSILSITVSLAPFLGLLGTVWGILITFSQLQSGASQASSQLVMGGLSMALGTTVCGLIVAIPALVAYNTLKNKATDLTIEMEDYATLLLAYLEKGYGAKEKL